MVFYIFYTVYDPSILIRSGDIFLIMEKNVYNRLKHLSFDYYSLSLCFDETTLARFEEDSVFFSFFSEFDIEPISNHAHQV